MSERHVDMQRTMSKSSVAWWTRRSRSGVLRSVNLSARFNAGITANDRETT